jgi:hypothetical protein
MHFNIAFHPNIIQKVLFKARKMHIAEKEGIKAKNPSLLIVKKDLIHLSKLRKS